MKRVLWLTVLIMALWGAEAWADELIMENKCEENALNAVLTEGSIDNSLYYHAESGFDTGYLPYEMSSDFLYELDIRFNIEGGGFSFVKKGKWNSCIRIKDGYLALQTGGNSFTKLTKINLERWYHISFLGRTNREANPVTYGHIILEEYNDKNEKVNRQVFCDVNLRNNAATHFINVIGGTDVDNLRAYIPSPTSMELFCDTKSIAAGSETQFNVRCMWNDLEMRGVNYGDISFELYDGENKYPLEDDNVTLDALGKLRTTVLCPGMKVNVRAVSKSAKLTAVCELDIVREDIFTIAGIGVSENLSKITEVSVIKNFGAYNDNFTIVVTFAGEDGTFLGADYKNVKGGALNEGLNKVAVSFELPGGFDINRGKIRVYTVTNINGVRADEIVASDRDSLPEMEGMVTVITIKDEADIRKTEKGDILFFDITDGGTIYIPKEGKTYVLGNVNKADVLFEVIK